jgi:hypothetical protein
MSDKFVVPRKGLLVRDPISLTPLPAAGMMKPWSGRLGVYWKRRWRCGDVTIGKRPPKHPDSMSRTTTKSKTKTEVKERGRNKP